MAWKRSRRREASLGGSGSVWQFPPHRRYPCADRDVAAPGGGFGFRYRPVLQGPPYWDAPYRRTAPGGSPWRPQAFRAPGQVSRAAGQPSSALIERPASSQTLGDCPLTCQACLQRGNQRVADRSILPGCLQAAFQVIETLERLFSGGHAGSQPGSRRFHPRLKLGRTGFQGLRPFQQTRRALGHLGIGARQFPGPWVKVSSAPSRVAAPPSSDAAPWESSAAPVCTWAAPWFS